MINGEQYITMATDASISHVYSIATWACYIVTPIGVLQYAGRLKDDTNVGIAETLAVANALAILNHNIPNLENYHLVAYSDCDGVITIPRTKTGAVRKRAIKKAEIITEYVNPITNKARSFSMKFVKAHTLKHGHRHPEAKYNMNNWCDIHSRRLLRQLVAAHKAGEVQ
jgi:hypothetical protein